MKSAEIKTILEEHSKWLEDNKNGKYANLRGANLRNEDLRDADLRNADLGEADLRGADLRGADFEGANLRGANLKRADLRWADLRWVNLRGADLRWVNLEGVDLRGADLRWADFEGANLKGTDLYYPIACPEEGSFIAWKKAENCIVKLEVLEDAKRSSAANRKCRCDKARVVAIENIDGSESRIAEVNSNYDKEFIYRVGEIVTVDDFDDDRWNECAPGIHFFITREEAVRY
nr:MAG TPA: pentapeptide repeat protein [Caudoviricetes sp.]